jgi:hypothetical protein
MHRSGSLVISAQFQSRREPLDLALDCKLLRSHRSIGMVASHWAHTHLFWTIFSRNLEQICGPADTACVHPGPSRQRHSPTLLSHSNLSTAAAQALAIPWRRVTYHHPPRCLIAANPLFELPKRKVVQQGSFSHKGDSGVYIELSGRKTEDPSLSCQAT